ncbi:MAG: ECF transporter S component [Clostridia bacterium]|nr:ECF transporter S component [Clostridia bacterium]
MSNKRIKTRELTGIAMFTAIVIVLQLLGAFIRFGPFSISLVLVPIVLGATLYGPFAGAWLGFVFGATVLISGDAAPFLAVSIFGTVLTVLLKGSLAGFVSGLLYRALSAKSKTFAGILAAFSCPVVNTGVFLLGCIVFFMPTVTAWGTAMGFENVWRYMIFGLVGGNFLFEMLVNIILCPVILRLIRIAQKRRA